MTTSDDIPHRSPGPRPAGEPQGTTDEERNWAMAAHAGSFVAAWVALGFMAPLIVLLLKGNRSAFVRQHAVESLNFQINALAYAALLVLLIFLLVGVLLLPLVPIYLLFYVISVVFGSIRASQGAKFRYPLTVRFIS